MPAKANPPPPERRAATRYLYNPNATCLLTATIDDDPWLVRVRNISLTGISLLTDRPVEAGRVVNLELRNPLRHLACRVPTQVLYVVEHPSGDWILGCKFVTELTPEQLRALT
ncbi:MAG: PilZ domain-containing protein [Gemmataceae bacterium]|nr:PilZ domain-containing protein [Gemmataceae bacterium]MDW8266067.1 PilZ domain-containing protein [Gemmataceae bacterium]